MWWRILIPTWRFFDSVGLQPELWVKADGDWQLAIERPQLHWYSIFFSPRYNYYHACCNLLDRLVQELSQGKVRSDLVSYRLVEDLAREALKISGSTAKHFELKVLAKGVEILKTSTLEGNP